ncbi:MAG: uroporphyrin-III C-methyltransferase / precorrin-2 dehydrogenase / sirohydrochlorin ferrochelatase [Frankiales bacterium]|nr:uroporphyrin-III C-methyltransferase / precorrin-2 dehydrogenase / sirohydrochlorin ferrochelatase [Frankiales bacterium]
MDRYPLLLDLTDAPVLVVGGGRVAARRVRGLLGCGARVTVVAIAVAAEIGELPVGIRKRDYQSSDIEGARLVLACTDDPAVNAAVHADATARGIWCVRVDSAADSSAWVPAVGRVDGMTVAVSAGADPRRAVAVRDVVVRQLRDGTLHAPRGRRRAGVVLVGGGPGDPGLLTLRGYRELLDADVVVHDRLGPTGLLAGLPTDVEVIDVGKAPRGPAVTQEEINALLVDRARSGLRVVRLKGGDPFVFGRGGEEVAACVAADVPIEVVPGVSSATAAPSLAGIPVTHRGTTQHLVVASGHVPPGDERSTVDWAALGASDATLVLLMAVENIAGIAAEVQRGGRPGSTPCAVIADASLPTEQVLVSTLAQLAGAIAEAAVGPPAVVVVGDVVSHRAPWRGGRSAPA